jgi:hypothetical protein
MKTFICIERRGRYVRADDRQLGLNRQFVRAHGGKTKHFASEEAAFTAGCDALNRAPGSSIAVMAVDHPRDVLGGGAYSREIGRAA